MDFTQMVQMILGIVAALAGYPALLSVIATALEYWGWLKDEYTDDFMFWGSAVGFVWVFVAALLGKIDLVNEIDAVLGQVAQIISLALILLGIPVSFAVSKGVQGQLRKARFVGLQ